ncbi:MAG: hypothetical protein KDJ36_12805 [Hyphomicrobiaceae bacterium]|nr:hypothetical protein [Hyphomicrobiaceae bacterium]
MTSDSRCRPPLFLLLFFITASAAAAQNAPTIKGQELPTSARAVAFSSDGRYLYTASPTSFAKWNIASGQRMAAIRLNAGQIDNFAIDHQRNRALLSGYIGQAPSGFMHGILDLNLFGTNSSTSPTNDIKRNKAISSLGYSTRTIEVHADLNLYSFGINKQIVFLDAKTLKIIGKRPTHFSTTHSVVIARNASRALKRDGDAILGYDLRKKAPLPELIGHPGGTEYLHISDDGKRALTSGSNSFAMWDVETGRELFRRKAFTGFKDRWGGTVSIPIARILAVTGDLRYFVTGAERLYVYDTKHHRLIAELPGLDDTKSHHADYRQEVSFSLDGTLIAATGKKKILVWNISSVLQAP